MPKNSKGSGKPIPQVEVELEMSAQQAKDLLETLGARFENNMDRHQGLVWQKVRQKLEAHPRKLSSLFAMESTGGEPDVFEFDQASDQFVFYDFCEQSPEGRRSICYDGEGQHIREKKGVHPGGNAMDLAEVMGIELLDESQYRKLQELGEFDTKTQSWIKTPADIRQLGGAIFADRRYGRVFVFHNSAESFYSSRGFRGALRV
jgi:hypothetical protein